MKIIFLDIDGVLIRFGDTEQIRKTRERKGQEKDFIITSFDEDLVENLKKIIRETNCKFVISSAWRRNMMADLREQWLINGLDWNLVISVTPDTLGHGRGNEILHWLNDYHKTCKPGFHIKNWVAIDDDAFDMKAIKRLNRLIHTKTHLGLDEERANKTIKILNS